MCGFHHCGAEAFAEDASSFSRYVRPRTRMNSNPPIHIRSMKPSPVKHHPYPIDLNIASMMAAAIAAATFLSNPDSAISAAADVGMHSVW